MYPKLKLLWASISLGIYKEGQDIGEEACVLKLINFRGCHDIAVSRQESKDTGFYKVLDVDRMSDVLYFLCVLIIVCLSFEFIK